MTLLDNVSTQSKQRAEGRSVSVPLGRGLIWLWRHIFTYFTSRPSCPWPTPSTIHQLHGSSSSSLDSSLATSKFPSVGVHHPRIPFLLCVCVVHCSGDNFVSPCYTAQHLHTSCQINASKDFSSTRLPANTSCFEKRKKECTRQYTTDHPPIRSSSTPIISLTELHASNSRNKIFKQSSVETLSDVAHV